MSSIQARYGPSYDSVSHLSPAVVDLYRHHWRDLCAFLVRRFGSGPPDPEDIAQGAFLRIAELPPDTVIQNPRALLFRTAHNLMIDHKRSQHRRRNLLARSDVLLAPEDGAEPVGESVLIAKEGLRALERAIQGLPPRHRSYFLANRVWDLSFAEIARRTGASQSCVRKIVEEALEACQDAVRENRPVDVRRLSRERSVGGRHR